MRSVSSLLALTACVLLAPAAAPPAVPPPLPPEFRDYRSVDAAVQAKPGAVAAQAPKAQPGYLGVTTEAKDGKLVVAAVEPDSPAAKAGISAGDRLLKVGAEAVLDPAALGEAVRAVAPGEKLFLLVERDGKAVSKAVTLAATSRPLTPGSRRVVMGVTIEPVAEGLKLRSVTPGLPADKAQLKAGDVLVAVEGQSLAGKDSITGMAERKPGDKVKLEVKRGEKKLDVVVVLVGDPTQGRGRGRGGRGWDDGQPRVFRRPAYKLALIGIEYPDVAHNAKVKPSDWDEALFSTGRYTGRSVTGQRVYGSMNDYWLEQSCGKFRVEGKAFDWVKVKRKRAEYASDSNRAALLTEAVDALLARDKKALDGFDGIFFLYAGESFRTSRGGLYWPHRASFRHNGKSWPYFICPEGGRTMASISVLTHEFGHLLGLPDLYARPEVPGEEGLGVWCTMAVGHGRDGKPLHLSAWCKERLGWLKPAVIDPRVKQKLVLSPIENTTRECYKVLVRPDGSEYFLLENRARKNFDRDLPAEGLLIWRVVNGRPVLEESHGIGGPSGPNLYLGSIPYPSGSNNAFTPHTTPSSKSLKGGGLPVWITNIRKLSDGRVAFQIGYEYH